MKTVPDVTARGMALNNVCLVAVKKVEESCRGKKLKNVDFKFQ
jgi:hypothetical protein